MKYKVVSISNNLKDYPECKKDTEEYPEIVKHVDDEMALFIVDENGEFWPAGEFFYMVDIDKFSV